jgi:hypothetical protein
LKDQAFLNGPEKEKLEMELDRMFPNAQTKESPAPLSGWIRPFLLVRETGNEYDFLT